MTIALHPLGRPGRPRRAWLVAALAGSVGAAIVVGGGTMTMQEASAKSGYDSLYSLDQTWNSAVRLVRVDLGYKIVEKDVQSGYLLFEYVDKDRTSSASLEFLASDKGVRVVCQIPRFPTYHEAVILDRLSRKLKDDYGAPPERPRPAPDAGGGGDAGPDAP